MYNGVGVLYKELRMCNSLIKTAGSALAVDRFKFSKSIDYLIKNDHNINCIKK